MSLGTGIGIFTGQTFSKPPVKLRIRADEVKSFYGGPFPRYTTQIINLISNTAQATRPRVIGQMSELVAEFIETYPDGSVEEWRQWYLGRNPSTIDDATDKIYEKLHLYKDAIHEIDRSMIRRWVEDLVIYKSFKGLKFQALIIRKVAERCKMEHRMATSSEESAGIDGFIGNVPVQVKRRNGEPHHILMDALPPSRVLLSYRETSDGSLSIRFDESKILSGLCGPSQ